MQADDVMPPGPVRLPEVAPVDRDAEAGLRACVDGKAKPPGSLGRIEDLAVTLGLIRHPAKPDAERATVLVFAGDHGLTQEGVSRYPDSVTAAMVMTFLAGKAAINACAAAVGAEIRVIDAGVAADLPGHPNLIAAKIAPGTRNAAREPAMTIAQAVAALEKGSAIAEQAIASGADVIVLGEMGIGNTASASLLMHRLAPMPLAECIGEGAGQDEAGLARKRAAIARAALRSNATRPLDVLAEFGGYEIAMMAGALIGAAGSRRPVVIDGFIATAAALVAIRMQPAARDYCIFGHASAEQGHRALLKILAAQPLLDLKLRLGEGTGAVLAVPLIRAAARLLTDVADLKDVLAGTLTNVADS